MSAIKTDLKLGYLLVTTPVPNVYIGGIMVTDARGLPIEFRYTEPIQPTRIQQILYGQVLSAYIKREVILETLLKSVESKFKCLLVEDEHLVNYPAKGFTIIRVTETKSPPLGAVGATEAITATEILLQTSQEGSPLRLSLSDPKQQPQQTLPMGLEDPVSSGGQPPYLSLLDASKTMDVQEPIKRIAKALEIICQEEGITSAT